MGTKRYKLGEIIPTGKDVCRQIEFVMLRKSVFSSHLRSLVTSPLQNPLKLTSSPSLYPHQFISFPSCPKRREYHQTSFLLKRNDGASGGLERPREFSKKQKKRFKLKVNESKEKSQRDPLKHQKMEALKTHMESPETKQFIQETQES